jgi:hypothetical protein
MITQITKKSPRLFLSVLIIIIFINVTHAESETTFTPIDLTSYFNNDGIAFDHNLNDGDFDAIGIFSPGTFNYAGEALPESNSMVTCSGIPFRFPDKSDGEKNNILLAGQTIAVPQGKYTVIYTLGASVNGNFEEPVIFRFSDGSEEKILLGLSDWCQSPKFGEVAAIYADFRQMKFGDRAPDTNNIWLKTIAIDSTKDLTAFQLPTHQCMHLFAITLGTGTIPQITSFDTNNKTEQLEPSKPQLQLTTNQAANLFTLDQPIKITISGENFTQDVNPIKVSYQITDSENILVLAKEETMSLNEGTFKLTCSLQSTSLGWYRVKAMAKLDNEQTIEKKTLVAVVPTIGSSSFSPNSIFGMGLGFSVFSEEEMKVIRKLVNTAGIKWCREEFSWGKIQPLKNKWVWDNYDKSVEYAQKYGIYQLGLLDYWTGWTKPYTKEGFQDYANYVEQVVNRYKNKVKYWEIWNEPNIFYWKGTPEQYTQLLKSAYIAAKKADPDCVIIGCTTAGIDTAFIERVFQAGGGKYLDAVSVHPYRSGYPEESNFLGDIQKLNSVIEKYGEKQRIWITEMGWWSSEQPTDSGVTEEKQAECLARSYLTAIVSGLVDHFFWYSFRDAGWLNSYSEHNFGIVRPDNTLKPSYLAYVTLTQELENAKYLGPRNFGKDIYAYQFEITGKQLIVFWTKTGKKALTLHCENNNPILISLAGTKRILIPFENKIIISATESPTFMEGNFSKISVAQNFIDLHLPKGPMVRGQPTEIQIKLTNLFSKDIISNISIAAGNYLEENILADPETCSIKVKKGKEQECWFKLQPSNDASIGLTPLRIDVGLGNSSFRIVTDLVIENKKNNHKTPEK